LHVTISNATENTTRYSKQDMENYSFIKEMFVQQTDRQSNKETDRHQTDRHLKNVHT